MMLSASEARPGPDVQNVNGWTMFFLRVAWESRNQSKRELSGASSSSSQAAPVVGSRSFSQQPPWLFEAQPARRACRYAEQIDPVVDQFTAKDVVALAAG